jgi:hypothetical protein
MIGQVDKSNVFIIGASSLSRAGAVGGRLFSSQSAVGCRFVDRYGDADAVTLCLQ